MTISEAVYKWRTFVPVKFQRAVAGAPVADAPDVDDRGFKAPERAPVVGIHAGDTIRVAVRRAALDNGSVLFATSSDTSVVTVHRPSGGRLPSGDTVVLHLTGVAGAAGSAAVRKAKIQIHHGSTGGPVLGELHVWVGARLLVNLTPHLVTIRNAAGASRAPTVDVGQVMTLVQAIYRPLGIVFNVAATVSDTVTFAAAGEVAAPFSSATGYQGTELATLLNTNWAGNNINAYFVYRIRSSNPGVLGLGFSRPRSVQRNLPNPGIVLAETNVSGDTRDLQYWANDLAHEAGHFFTLEHSGNRQPPNHLQDMWARRMLMYNHNWQAGGAPVAFRSDVGYGSISSGHHRGCLFTMKSGVITQDGEYDRARGQAANPY